MFEGYCDNVQKLLLDVLRKHQRKGKGQSGWEKNSTMRQGGNNTGWLCTSWLLVSVLVWLDPVPLCCTFSLNTISNHFPCECGLHSQCVPVRICSVSELQAGQTNKLEENSSRWDPSSKPENGKKPRPYVLEGLPRLGWSTQKCGQAWVITEWEYAYTPLMSFKPG